MSSPYYMFGIESRYPFDWNAGQGGVLQATRAAETRALGAADMRESGLEPGAFLPYPAFRNTILHQGRRRRRLHQPLGVSDTDYAILVAGTVKPPPPPKHRVSFADRLRHVFSPRPRGMGDWPLVRPSGPEPIDPNEGSWGSPLGTISLSDNEKTLLLAAAAAGAAWWLFLRKGGRKRRRNPRGPVRYSVSSSTRGARGSVGFTTKAAAVSYAESLRRAGKRAIVRKR
jgi:hypothetical protein